MQISKHILIADDDAATRMLLRATLSQWGYLVREAVNGLDAIQQLQLSDPPPIALVDWMMPELDGIGFCKRVKKEMAHPPYIIILTSFTGPSHIVKALDAGANEFLTKPFNPAELHSRLRAAERILQYEYSEKMSETKLIETEQKAFPELMDKINKLNLLLDRLENHISHPVDKDFCIDIQVLLTEIKTTLAIQRSLIKTIGMVKKDK